MRSFLVFPLHFCPVFFFFFSPSALRFRPMLYFLAIGPLPFLTSLLQKKPALLSLICHGLPCPPPHHRILQFFSACRCERAESLKSPWLKESVTVRNQGGSSLTEQSPSSKQKRKRKMPNLSHCCSWEHARAASDRVLTAPLNTHGLFWQRRKRNRHTCGYCQKGEGKD